MGNEPPKPCKSCFQNICGQKQYDCFYCNKQVCKNCAQRRPATQELYKVWVCLICMMNQEGSKSERDYDEQDFGKPIFCKKMISITHNRVTGEYVGMPTIWRELLDTPIIYSKDEIDTSEWDEKVAAIRPHDDIVFQLQVKKAGQLFCIATPDITKAKFEAKYNKENDTWEGLPECIAKRIKEFSKTEVYESPETALNIALRALEGQKNIHKNIILKMENLPTQKQYQELIKKHVKLIKADPSNDYDIIKELGTGSFAKVYLVRNKKTEEELALKYIGYRCCKELKKIRNEIGINMLCECNQNIVKCYQAYDFNKKVWLFMENMDYGALSQYVTVVQGNIPENICKYILQSTLNGLNYMHERNIMHRDIKSDNILVNSYGDIKLADFGYAAQLTQEQSARRTQVGTSCWMAPEVILGKKQYDNKVDIWSFGIFALELADGEPPYMDQSQEKILYKIAKKDPPKLKSDKWSKEFQDFIGKCLNKRPEQRCSAIELLMHDFLKDADQQREEFVYFIMDIRKKMGLDD